LEPAKLSAQAEFIFEAKWAAERDTAEQYGSERPAHRLHTSIPTAGINRPIYAGSPRFWVQMRQKVFTHLGSYAAPKAREHMLKRQGRSNSDPINQLQALKHRAKSLEFKRSYQQSSLQSARYGPSFFAQTHAQQTNTAPSPRTSSLFGPAPRPPSGIPAFPLHTKGTKNVPHGKYNLIVPLFVTVRDCGDCISREHDSTLRCASYSI
jgi:hypothetical protein